MQRNQRNRMMNVHLILQGLFAAPVLRRIDRRKIDLVVPVCGKALSVIFIIQHAELIQLGRGAMVLLVPDQNALPGPLLFQQKRTRPEQLPMFAPAITRCLAGRLRIHSRCREPEIL